MRSKSTTLCFLLLYLGAGCKTGYDLETDALTRFTLQKSDTIYHFQAVKPAEKNPKVNQSIFYYWFRPDTILVTRGGFDGKLLNGEYKSFYPNKNLKESGRFKAGLKTGEWKSWYSNGELQSVTKWQAGKKEGKFQEFTPDGDKQRTGNYKKDKLSGYITTYSGGTEAYKEKYREGEPVIKKEKSDSRKKKAPDAAQY
ncbi:MULTISPECIES: toxin-antitoxin system YwqK family antitoxin [Niastella]|uniref:Membrane-binding protein n=1 Tax=Niastella soli TaxID=2821487 RepID=A0ABS3YWN2_9BACT|nr:hypothetical protein [Niastella soli]MBO9202341.1 hypothetical protein [Niastella soli]